MQTTARERGLPDPIADRYRAWIFVFVAWCLKAPPGRIRRTRIGDFWTALTQRPVGRWKVCEAMDALGFLFGTLGGAEQLSVPTGCEEEATGALDPSGGTGTIEPVEREELDLSLTRPNPKLDAFESIDPAGAEGGGREVDDLSQYLPDGTLPKEANAREAVPTRDERPEEESGREVPEDAPPTAPEPRDGSRRSPSRRDGAPTLFNPEGTPLPTDEKDRAGEDGAGPEPPGADGGQNGSVPASSTSAGYCRLPEVDEQPSGDAADDSQTLPFDADAVDEADPANDIEETVPIRIPRALADRVRRAAHRLGLPPGIFSARALDLICNDIGVDRSTQDRPHSTLAHYQAQLDLLHLGERVGFDEESEADRPATTTETDAATRGASGTAPAQKAAGAVPNARGPSEADAHAEE